MRVDPTHPANALAIRELRSLAPGARPVTPAAEAEDPYYECGCHPDVVERLWDHLGKSLPADARCLVYGRPALVQPESGVILAVCMGTSYAMRVPEEQLAAALAAGCTQTHEWGQGSGHVTDLVREYGPDWVFPGGAREQVEWCRQVYERFNARAAGDEVLLTPATPAQAAHRAGTVVLEVFDPPDWKPREVATDPDAETIARTVRGLPWSDITFVVLRKDEKNYFEASGSLDPGDGFSATYVEDGVEHLSREAPESLDVVVALLGSYRSDDGKWRTMIAWD